MKKNTQRTCCRLLLLALACMMTSCATMGKAPQARVTEGPERMFWRIEGVDRRGKPATVYVQGSFHLGDDRLYPLEKSVMEAWTNADRLVAEVSSADYDRLTDRITELVAQSYRKAAGRVITDNLTAAQNATLSAYIEAEVLQNLALFEPWIISYSLAAALYTNSGLTMEKGLDTVLLSAAKEAGRPVEGLDSLQAQIDGITYGSYDEQMVMLRDLLDDLTDPSEALADIKALYEAYLADNRAQVNRLNQDSMDEDTAEHAFYADYYRLLINDRNKDWAQDITGYLREGGTTFIFAGAAHWVGDNSVFSYLKKMGTIE